MQFNFPMQGKMPLNTTKPKQNLKHYNMNSVRIKKCIRITLEKIFQMLKLISWAWSYRYFILHIFILSIASQIFY